MEKIIRARKEFYHFLYGRYKAEEGPWCGKSELAEFSQTVSFIRQAELFAKDMGHIKYNRFGGVRLTGQGILYAEQEFSGD